MKSLVELRGFSEIKGTEAEEFERAIVNNIVDNGYCLVRGVGTEDFLPMATKLGDIQFHPKADERGVVGEGDSKSNRWKKNANEYIGHKREAISPHTDGSFLNTMTSSGFGLKRVLPPALIVIQCLQDGGSEAPVMNTIVDLSAVLKELKVHDLNVFSILSTPGCVSFFRDDQKAVDVSIFKKNGKGKLHVRYNAGRFMYYPKWSEKAILHFHNQYVLNPRFHQEFCLKRGDIAIIDNLRILHARDEIQLFHSTSARKIRRVWISQKDADFLRNIPSERPTHSVLEDSDSYLPIERNEKNSLLNTDNLGIKI